MFPPSKSNFPPARKSSLTADGGCTLAHSRLQAAVDRGKAALIFAMYEQIVLEWRPPVPAQSRVATGFGAVRWVTHPEPRMVPKGSDTSAAAGAFEIIPVRAPARAQLGSSAASSRHR